MIPDKIRPTILPPQLEILEGHRICNEFHQEVEYRRKFQHHCQWYQQTAQRHRQELQKMRGDINILSWFRR